MLLGYARSSTSDQLAGFEAQLSTLKAAGCERIFSEQVSSVAVRAQLEAVLDFARDGDTVVVTKLDRLARSVSNLLSIVARLEAKGVALRVLSMGDTVVDTGTATGKLMLTMLGAVAEFERGLMLERQREGIAKTKADDKEREPGERKYAGRKPTARAKAEKVLNLHKDGTPVAEIARQLGMGQASAFRILRAAREQEAPKVP